MNWFKENYIKLLDRHGRAIFGGLFFMFFVVAFARGLGYNSIGFWFLVGSNTIALILYFTEKEKAYKRQLEINRYRKNGVKARHD